MILNKLTQSDNMQIFEKQGFHTPYIKLVEDRFGVVMEQTIGIAVRYKYMEHQTCINASPAH